MKLFSRRAALGAAVLTTALSAAFPAVAATDIVLAHQLDAVRAGRLETLVQQFNKHHNAYKVTLVQKAAGGTPAVLNLATPESIASFTGQQAKFRPIQQVMADAGKSFDGSQFAPELRTRIVDARGNFLALPVAMSTPVLFYNKAAFKKAGLDPNKPPRTWWDVQEYAGKLRAAEIECPYTSSWPTWVHVDNAAALNGAAISNAKGELVFNGFVEIKHVALLATWAKAEYFIYFGRRDEADQHFASGECAMLTSNSELAATLRDSRELSFGVAPLPYYDDVPGAPKHTLADGASLWVGEGKKADEYKGAAAFIEYLLSPEMQVELTKAGGYLPMTTSARAAADSKLLSGDLAGLRVAYSQLKGGEGVSQPVRVSQIPAVRLIVDEELEAVWSDKKAAKPALDTAVSRGNAVLQSKRPAAVPAKKRK